VSDDELVADVPPVDLGPGTVTSLTVGSHSCALFDDGTITCWDIGLWGLGYASTEDTGDNETPATAGRKTYCPQGSSRAK
jgi:hypothetical protein